MTDLTAPGLDANGNGAPAKWGTAGEYCYCTTGSSDFCDFCDEWVGKCWCWNNGEDDDGVDDD